MIIMNRLVLSAALVLGLGLTKVHAQVEQGVVGKIFDDLKENTRTVHEINKQGLATQKETFRARHEEAIEPNPEFVKFREAKGLKNKMTVVAESFRESCKEASEKEKERREQIKSFEAYRTVCGSLYASKDVAGLINQSVSLGLGYRFGK